MKETDGTPRPVSVSRLRALLTRTRLVGAIAVLLMLATGIGWSLASPIGGSPDDDYHLGSIWCPRPVESSGCHTIVIDGVVNVLVPGVIHPHPCYAFRPSDSAACSTSKPKEVYSFRYDDGNYPKGYYRFHHLLVGDHVTRSVVLMRFVNVLIAVTLLSAIGILAPPEQRSRYVVAIGMAWIPMGVYFVASNNPSSWALTGVLGYAAGLFYSLRTSGRRQWALLGLGVVGAVLACTSRGDSAFYLSAVSVAVFVGVRWRRSILPHAAVAAVVSVIGVVVMLGTQQAGYAVGGGGESPPLNATRLYTIFLSLPQFLAGFYGRRWGPGWFDVPLDGVVTIAALLLVGVVLFLGARAFCWRRVVSALILFGTIAGIAVLFAILNGMSNFYTAIQPRYMLPLLAVFYLVWLYDKDGTPLMTRMQTVMVIMTSALTNGMALHMVLLRYTHGVPDADKATFNLDHAGTWWWGPSVSPMTMWAAVSLAYLLGALLLAQVVRPGAGPGKDLPPGGRETDPLGSDTASTDPTPVALATAEPATVG